jgi:hypothetical protein
MHYLQQPKNLFNISPDETAFIETVIEGSEKITLHGNILGKLLLQKGEIAKLCYLLVNPLLTVSSLRSCSVSIDCCKSAVTEAMQ